MKQYLPFLAALGLALAGSHGGLPIRGFGPDEVGAERDRETEVKTIPNAGRIRTLAKWMSAQPHAAGSARSRQVAQFIAQELTQWGLETSIESFDALLPYPTVRILEMVGPKHAVAQLREPAIAADKDSGQPGQLPTYNAYSASGDVTAPLVYVNYGVPEDYEELSRRGIDVRDKIVIARYGKGWRGVKPKLAQEHGAIGCLIYSDPREDGFYMGDVYPVGPYRPGQGVQRGSVMDMPLYPGDPLTPGWASDKGARRLPRSEAKSLMRIPVLPISANDAEPLVAALGGPVSPEGWRGSLPVTYHIGPGPATVHLKLDFDWTSKPLYDVIAKIPGSVFPDQWIMWGNHHDAWVNGASDPVSGTSALLEAARSAAEMVQRGWKPKRTILFAFWDAEEFGLVGSTEWAEKHQAELDRKLAVYLNSDSTGRGALNGSGSHALEQFVNEIARDVADPLSGVSLGETMTARRASGAGKPKAGPAIRLGPLGAGSDYVPFLDHLGVSSLNLAFGGDDGGGVYHSVYDSFQWYARFSDRDFSFGRTLAQVMAVALMRLADASVFPYEFGCLARTVRTYADEIQKQSGTLDLRNVYAQIGRLEGNSRNYEDALASAGNRIAHATPAKIEKLNEALFRSERTLLSAKGLPGRQWYRHELYAPGRYTGYGAKTLPGIREAVEGSRWDEANQEAGRVVQALRALNIQVEEAVRLLRELED